MKNLKFIFLIIILSSLFLFPVFVEADLVPCGGPGELPCQLCHLFVMLDRIIDFVLIYIVFPVATLLLVIGGAIFMFSAEDQNRLAQGKLIMTSVLIGLVIIFSAWLLIGLFLSAIGLSQAGIDLISPDKWFVIDCPVGIVQPEPKLEPEPEPVLPPDYKQIVFVTERAHHGNFEAFEWENDGRADDPNNARDDLNAFCRENMPANLPPDRVANITAFISVKEGDAIKDIPDKFGFDRDDPIYWWHVKYGKRPGLRGRIAPDWRGMLDGWIENSQNEGTGHRDVVWTGSTEYGSKFKNRSCENWTTTELSAVEDGVERFFWAELGSGVGTTPFWLDGASTRCLWYNYIRCIAMYTPAP